MERGGLLASLVHTSPESGGPWTASFVSGFLARTLLDPPGESLLRILERPPSAPLTDTSLAQGIEAVLDGHRAVPELDLGREWTRLFVGPRGAPCRPWQDTWDPTAPPRLRGRQHLSVLRLWERSGLRPPHPESEPADHAGLILALGSALAARAASSEPEALALFDELWSAHVANWIPSFAATLIREARDPYHASIGRLLADGTGRP